MNCNLSTAEYILQVAAFRATLEEISESSLLVHVVDIRYTWHTLKDNRYLGANFIYLHLLLYSAIL